MKKRVLSILLCCATAAALLTGCGGGETPSKTDNNDTDSIVVAYDRKVPLDPFTYSNDLTRNIVDYLIEFDREQAENEGITLVLAESYNHSDDKKTWTFTLRDAQFSNGSALDAGDVVASLEYALTTPMGAGNYEGYHAEAQDDKTVVFTTDRYSDNVPYYLARLPIIDAETFESLGEDEYFSQMIGTGAYVLDSYDEATGLAKLAANESYWGEQPAITHVTMRYIPDPNTALIALRGGEIDFASISSSNYSQAAGDDALKIQFSRPILGNYLVFNAQADPVSNQKLRQAILYAIDTEGIAAMSAVEGDYQVLHGFYQPEWGVDKPENFTEYSYDPDKARELIAESGLQTPIDLGTINIMDSQKSIWEVVQQNLAEVGINIQISSVESTVWLDGIWKGDFLIAALTDTDIVASGYTGICDMFYSWGIESGYNYSRYSDPELDELLTAAAQSTEKADQNKYFGDALNIINDQALWGIIYTYGRIFAMDANLNAQTDIPDIYFNEMSWN